MRLSENRSEEIAALIRVIEAYPPRNRRDHCIWFYNQVRDIVSRQLEEDHEGVHEVSRR